VAGYAPFDRAVPGKQPSPHQLKMLAAISPALAEDYAALIYMERLANPPFTIPHLGLDRKMEYGQSLLDPVQHRLWAISWVQRTLPVIQSTHPEYLAVARMGLDAARWVIRGTSGEDVRARAQAEIQQAIREIEADHGYSEVTDPGYASLQAVDDVLYPLTSGYPASTSAIDAAADALAWQPDDEEGPQHIANATWVDLREEQLAELIAMLRLPPGERGTVGAKKIKKVSAQADPMASPLDLFNLAQRRPREALAHPNCPPDLWWSLASRFPREAIQSPLWDFQLIENPALCLELWNSIVQVFPLEAMQSEMWNEAQLGDAEHKRRLQWLWLELYTGKTSHPWKPPVLSLTERRLFAADCAERVLPVFEAAYPGELAPRRAIEAARKFAREEIDSDQLKSVRDKAFRVAEKVQQPTLRDGAVAWAAFAATAATWEPKAGAFEAAQHARSSSAYAVGDDGTVELDWQTNKLLWYLAQPRGKK